MQITPGDAASTKIQFKNDQAPRTNYNPPPKAEGIAPSRDAITAESRAAQSNPHGQNLDMFA